MIYRIMRLWVLAFFLSLALKTQVFAEKNTVPAVSSNQSVPQDFSITLGQQLEKVLGIPVRIGQLSYDLFTSTFNLKGFEIGSKQAPWAQIPFARISHRLMAQDGIDISRVEIRDPIIRVHTRWFDFPLNSKALGKLSLEKLRIQNGYLYLLGALDKLQWVFNEVSIEGEHIQVQVRSKTRRIMIKGSFSLKAQLKIAQESWGPIILRGNFKGDSLEVEEFALESPQLTFNLMGRVGMARGKLGPVRLMGKGNFQNDAFPKGAGDIKIIGTSILKSIMSVHIQSGGKIRILRKAIAKVLPK